LGLPEDDKPQSLDFIFTCDPVTFKKEQIKMQRALAESETKGGKPPDKNAPPVPKPLPPAKEIITADFMAREDFSNESFERLAKIILKNLEDGDNQKGNMEVIKDVITKNCLWSNQASQVLSSFTD
jgi:hypothetical protein